MKRVGIPLFVLLLLMLVGGAAYLGYRGSQSAPNAAARIPPTVAVDRGDVPQTLTAPGQLVGARDQLLSLNIGGRVARVHVRAGDAVKAGDALLQLDKRDLQYPLQTAQANLASAQANLNKLKEPPSAAPVNAARAQVASAQSAYDAAFAKYAHNDDQITVAQAALEKATVTLQHAQAAYDRVAGEAT